MSEVGETKEITTTDCGECGTVSDKEVNKPEYDCLNKRPESISARRSVSSSSSSSLEFGKASHQALCNSQKSSLNPEQQMCGRIMTPIMSDIHVAELSQDDDPSFDLEVMNDGDQISVASGQNCVFTNPVPKTSELTMMISEQTNLQNDLQRTEQLAAAQANTISPRTQGLESSTTIQLRSRRFVRNWLAWLLVVLVFLTVAFVSLYWLEVLLVAKWRTLLFNNPNNTMFTVAILSAATVIFLDKLVGVACDTLRWSLAARKGSDTYLLDFLALGCTTPVGLIILLFMPGKGESLRDNLRHASFRFWAALRLLISLLILVVNIILFLNMNVETTYIKTEKDNFPVRAGDLPFDFSSYRSNSSGSLRMKRLSALLTFGTRVNSNASYLNWPLIQGSPASYCPPKAKCGAMNIMRQYTFDENRVLGLTNISGNEFITLYRLPFYQIIGIRADPYWPFKNVTYGNYGVYSCGGLTEIVYAMKVLGQDVPWIAIGHSLFDATGYIGPDHKDLNLNLRQKTAGYLAIQRHYADFTYDLTRRGGPVIVENTMATDTFVDIDPQDYLSVFDLLFPPFASTADDSLPCNLFFAAAELLQDAVNGNEIWEVLLLPFIQQQGIGVPLYEEPIVNASFRKQSYKITVATSSTQIFVSITFTILGFCLIVMLISRFERIPETLPFTEFDIIGKMIFQDNKTPEGKLSSQLFQMKSWDMVRAMWGMRLHVNESERAGFMDDTELVERGMN